MLIEVKAPPLPPAPHKGLPDSYFNLFSCVLVLNQSLLFQYFPQDLLFCCVYVITTILLLL